MSEVSEEVRLKERMEELNIQGDQLNMAVGKGDEDRLEDSLDVGKEEEEKEERPGVLLLKSWLNKCIKIEMTDGRFIMGVFLCTDKCSNVIVGNCTEYTKDPDLSSELEEPRMLGLAMVPGHHIVKLFIDQYSLPNHSEPLRTSPIFDSDS